MSKEWEGVEYRMYVKIITKEKEENIKYLFSVAKERKIPDGPEAEYYK